MQVSLIIPAYNEAGRIGATLRDVLGYLRQQDYASEVLVVDDGSTDATADAVRDAIAERGGDDAPPLRLIAYMPNRGKGHAVKTGMLEARGARRVFYDADGSTPIGELGRMYACFEEGADVVIGSRALPESDVAIRQAWYRESMGRLFNKLMRLAVGLPYPDTQCGFKGFTAKACAVLFPRQTIDGFSFDAELLCIARLHGLRIEQVPVRWLNSGDSSVRLVRDSVRMLRELWQIRLNRARGLYG
jgi:dolichyl-phosphate beta-glucosyltransferase